MEAAKTELTFKNMECNKSKFLNEKFALDWIEKLKRTSVREKVPLRAYLCTRCGTWHLTSRPEFGDPEKEALKANIERLQDELSKSKDSAAAMDKKYKALVQTIHGVINVSNATLMGSAEGGKKNKKAILYGANLMRELLKEMISNLDKKS